MGRTMRPRAAVAALLAVVLAGCGGTTRSATAPAVEAKPAKPGCDGTIKGYRTRGEALRGDVNGDDSADRVTLRADRRRPPACRRVVVVETGSKTIATAVRPLPWPGTAPRLLLLAEIDGRSGVEPVVTLSPANVYRPGAVFAARHGRLVRLRLSGGNLFPLADEFPASTDCAGEPGRIEVITSQVAQDDSYWDVERSVYRARGRRFKRLRTERFRAPVGSEVTGESFRSCQARSITSTE
jgi:hypothetical protein